MKQTQSNSLRFYFAFFLLAFLFQSTQLTGQRYFTKDGKVHFVSETPMEKIEAVNHKSTCVLDMTTGQIQIAILIKSFHFEKALMEEHFNENYMESNKYPKAVFKGIIGDYEPSKLLSNEIYQVTVKGTMTIHGVTQDMTVEGSLQNTNEKIHALASFGIVCEDYEISIPGLVRENIAESLEIRSDFMLQPLAQ